MVRLKPIRARTVKLTPPRARIVDPEFVRENLGAELSPRKSNALDCYNELQSRARTIEAQQARLDAIAAMITDIDSQFASDSCSLTGTESRQLYVLARGKPARELKAALKRWGKKENPNGTK